MYCYDLTKIKLPFINRKLNMLNWKCMYLIGIGYFIKS